MKTTDWFSNIINPVYPGLYEVNMNTWPWPVLVEWTETGWATDIKINEWRGLQEKTL